MLATLAGMTAQWEPIREARVEWRGRTPVSLDHGDSYFMPDRGSTESRTVFLEANQLARRFADLPADGQFVVGETGFGTGLNLLLAARCFLDHAPASAHLDLVSAERFPLSRGDLARAQPLAPELAGLVRALLDGYPPPVAGFHTLWLDRRVRLVLMLGDAVQCWQDSCAAVDAWFLDGFAPACNAEMWSADLFAALAARSRPGATLGTFTAASSVRRGLSEAGFSVDRVPGFAGKRHRLVGRRPGRWTARRLRRGLAVVAGAGLAGCTTARALAERGWQVRLCDPAGIAKGASGNLAGVVYTTASAHRTAQNRFYQLALIHALARFRSLNFPTCADDGRLNGVVQIAHDARMTRKIDQALEARTWPESLLERIDERTVVFHGAGFLRPARWCRHLVDHPGIAVTTERVDGFTSSEAVRVDTGVDACRQADVLVVSVAEASPQLPGLAWLPLKTIRGQVSYLRATVASQAWEQAICHAGYLTPALGGLHCAGATFDLNQNRTDLRDEDDRTNLTQLREQLPRHWDALGGDAIEVVDRRAAVRCQTPDFLPLAGPLADPQHLPHRVEPNVLLNLAHGSRGLTHTPLCAELVADRASGMDPALDSELLAALAPERFILRKRRRQPDWRPPA